MLLPSTVKYTPERRAYLEQTIATSMLLDEYPPVVCSCCLGKGVVRAIFGHRECGQCKGTGFNLIGVKTAEAMGIPRVMDMFHRR